MPAQAERHVIDDQRKGELVLGNVEDGAGALAHGGERRRCQRLAHEENLSLVPDEPHGGGTQRRLPGTVRPTSTTRSPGSTAKEMAERNTGPAGS
jgi:hypothetical protein